MARRTFREVAIALVERTEVSIIEPLPSNEQNLTREPPPAIRRCPLVNRGSDFPPIDGAQGTTTANELPSCQARSVADLDLTVLADFEVYGIGASLDFHDDA